MKPDIDKWVEIKNVESVFLRGNEIIVTGHPLYNEDIEHEEADHNCDQMGCNSVEHIILRGYVNGMVKGYVPELQEVDANANR